MAVQHTPWPYALTPTEAALRKLLAEEGLSAYAWGNGPGERYPAHTHTFDKVIYVITGSIRFDLPESGQAVWLRAGDRLDLPAETVHSAAVGTEGVACLEAHRALSEQAAGR